MTIGGISVAVHLYPRLLLNKLVERLRQVPARELELIADHPGCGEEIEIVGIFSKILLQDRLHFFHVLHSHYPAVSQFTQALLHSLVQTKLFRLQHVLYLIVFLHNNLVHSIILCDCPHFLLQDFADAGFR